MREREIWRLACGCIATLLIALTGCSHAPKSDAEAAVHVAPQQKAMDDSRIPPAKRAEIERIMAQQQAGADQIGAKLKAATPTHH